MNRKPGWVAECPVVQTLERVGERWSILLLRELFRGAHRFDELQTSLGIAPNILSARLTRLVDAGFVNKRRYQEHPPRYSYHLTERGEDFIPVLFVLLEFGNKHFAPDGPKVAVVRRDTAEIAEPVVVDRKTGLAISGERYTIAATGLAGAQTQSKYSLKVHTPATTGRPKAAKKTTAKKARKVNQ
jgi:DNA-binding HxlR family transcriptional regulator